MRAAVFHGAGTGIKVEDIDLVAYPFLEVKGEMRQIRKNLKEEEEFLNRFKRRGLKKLLSVAERIAGHDYLVCAISDFDGADDDTRRHLIRLKRHNDLLGALIHDPSESQLPPGGSLVVTDGELQIELDLGKGRTRRALEDFAEWRVAGILNWQKEIGVPVLPINTAEGVAEQARRALGHAPQSRRA